MYHSLRRSLLPLLAMSCMAQAGIVSTHGALKVANAKLTNAAGTPIQLAGMSLYWPLWGGEKFFNSGAVSSTVKDWGASIVRVPMAVGNGSGSLYTGNTGPIKAAVDAAIANDVYVIIDWHVEQDAPQKDKALTFFADMAKTYGKQPHVMFEIWNEPAKASWSDVRSYAIDLVAEIRKYSSNVIIVGSPDWSKAVDQASANPVPGDNIAYTFHFYSCTHGATYRTKVANASSKIAIMFTEWGTTEASGGGSVCISETDAWLQLAKEKGISWANWSLSDKAESSAALTGGASTNGGWNDGNLTASGKYVKGKIGEVAKILAAMPTTPVIPVDPVVPVTPKVDTVPVPGKIEAEKASTLSADIKIETTTDAGGGSALGYTTNGSAEYTIKSGLTGNVVIRSRVATAENGTMNFKLNNNQIASLSVENTGGWQTWQTKETKARIDNTGNLKLQIQWTGAVNLNWVEIVSEQTSVSPRASALGFQVISQGREWLVDLPQGAHELVVSDLQGRVLSRESVVGKTQARIQASANACLVRLESWDGTRSTRLVPGI
ncbi:MAG: cellulase family glycosylhydrolase [Fibrobacteres bacterium]|nr:cellulase family glycosylhydrolase [Fibrobacterota bacterium]